MLKVEDWAEIRRLHRAEQVPIKAIARKLGVGRNTVRRALAADEPPRSQRPARGSIVDVVEPQIRALLAEWPQMPATVIAERIGWTRSLTVLKERVRELRPQFVPVDPASRAVDGDGDGAVEHLGRFEQAGVVAGWMAVAPWPRASAWSGSAAAPRAGTAAPVRGTNWTTTR